MATPLFSYVEPWHWDTSNDGWATAEETQQSYSALINKTRTNLFLMKVWNDMVLTVGYFRSMTERSWNTYYGTESDTYMRDGSDQLTANRFNALVVNVGYPRYSWQFEPTLESYIGRETFKGVAMVSANYADIVYAAYFIEIMQKLNILIAVCNGDIERCELAWQEYRALNISSDAVALPSAPIAYNLMIEGDVESATELSIQALQPFRVQHTDTLSLPCTLSVILGGFTSVETLFELFHVFSLTPLPSKLLASSNDITHSVYSTMSTLMPFYDWSAECQVGESSYEANMVALPTCCFRGLEEIPDIPITAVLGVSKPEAMSELFRITGIFDLELTVRRVYELEIVSTAVQASLLATMEHSRFSYMASPLFITSVFTASLCLAPSAGMQATYSIELCTICSLDWLMGKVLKARMDFDADFNTLGNRGVSIPLANKTAFSSSSIAVLERYSRPVSAHCDIYGYIMSYCTVEITDLLYLMSPFSLVNTVAFDATLSLYNNTVPLSVNLFGAIESTSGVLFMQPQPLQARVLHNISSEISFDMSYKLNLEGTIGAKVEETARLSIEGAAWLYPVQTNHDIYIRQVLKAEKHSNNILLDGNSISLAASLYLSFAFDSCLTITNTYCEAALYSSVLIHGTLDVLHTWMYPVVSSGDIFIPQVTQAISDTGALHIEHKPAHMLSEIQQEVISTALLDIVHK